MNTPYDILNYVLANEKEADFLNAIAYHVGNYTIAEIVDAKISKINNSYRLRSERYAINEEILDEDIVVALMNGLYVSSFLVRHNNVYQVHFLVHQYPERMKARFEDNVLKDVIRYMILRTIIALRLDNEKKVDNYLQLKYEQ